MNKNPENRENRINNGIGIIPIEVNGMRYEIPEVVTTESGFEIPISEELLETIKMALDPKKPEDLTKIPSILKKILVEQYGFKFPELEFPPVIEETRTDTGKVLREGRVKTSYLIPQSPDGDYRIN